MKSIPGLQSLEMLPEGLIDDLGDGQAVQVGLSTDRLNPALFDMEGHARGLTTLGPVCSPTFPLSLLLDSRVVEFEDVVY